ncbi:MAG: ATP-binding protein [Coraliomargarita sp.]
MKIYARLLLIQVILVVLFCLLAVFIGKRGEQEVLQVKADLTQRQGEVFDQILSLEHARLRTFAWDYSWWQDLIDWIEQPDRNVEFILDQFDQAPITYGADLFAVYSADGQRLTDILDSGMEVLEQTAVLPLQLDEAILSRERSRWFEPGFVNTPSGVLELYIAPVQPQEDRDRTGQHYGYLAMGRYWTESLLAELEGLTGTKIQMVEAPLPAMQSRPRQWTGEIHFSRSLNGLDGEPLYHLDVTMPLPVADRVISKQVEAFWVILTGTAVAVLLVIAFVLHWVSRPLKFLSDSLESGRTERLEQLMKTTSEFKHLAELVIENQEQALRLRKEIASHERTEDELTRSRDLAESANRAKARFLTNMSHETRTPLHRISGYASLLEGGELSEEQRESLALIRENCDRLVCMLTDLIELSGVESEELRLNKSVFPLNTLTDELSAAAISLCAGRPIEVLTDISRKCPKNLYTDYERLRLVVLKLIENAAKFTQKGTVMFAVYCNHDDADLVFEVRDTGPGIPREACQHVFDAFYQLDDSDSRTHQGGGLGLAIARQITELLGGEVELDSVEGEGSIFRMYLSLKSVAVADRKAAGRLAGSA